MRRVLIIEDDPDITRILATALPQQGCVVRAVDSRDSGLREIENGLVPELILMDYCMEGMSAEDFLQKLIAHSVRLPRVVIMTAADQAEVRARYIGVPEVLRKPFDPTNLFLSIDRCSA